MKKNISLVLVVILVASAALSLLWALHILDDLSTYRSPLQKTTPMPGKAPVAASSERLIYIIIDGLRVDASENVTAMPFLNELRAQSANAVMHSVAPTDSTPSYGVLLTGASPSLSDAPGFNVGYDAIWALTQDNIFSAASRAGLKTAASGYYWFEKLIPVANLHAGFFTPGEDEAADRDVVDAALPWLESGDYQLVLIHLDQVDYAGHHLGGGDSEGYRNSANIVDGLLTEIFKHVDLSADTVMILADHGHLDRGGHGGPEKVLTREPFVLLGAGVQPGAYGDVNMVDVVPTLAVLLGLNIPASTQGQVLTDMLDFSADEVAAIQKAEQSQRKCLVMAFETATDKALDLGDEFSTAEMNHAIKAVQQSKIFGRVVVALVVILGGFYLVSSLRQHHSFKLMTGALLFAILFHLIYLLVEKRGYSLAWFSSPEDFIITQVGTALACYAVVWLGLVFWFKLNRMSKKEAVMYTLSSSLAVVVLLLLPILAHYIMNGYALWIALPEYWTMFAGLQALLQVLAVSVGGLLLTGVAALLGRGSKAG